MKETGGDENNANEILLARSAAQAEASSQDNEPKVNIDATEVTDAPLDAKDDVKPLELSADNTKKGVGDSSNAPVSPESGSSGHEISKAKLKSRRRHLSSRGGRRFGYP